MRHDRATRLYQATGDLAAVQDLLGHSDPKTTRKYAHTSPEYIRAQMMRADAAEAPVVVKGSA